MGRVKAQREGMAGLPDRIYRRISSFVNETVGLVARITGYVSGLSLSLSLSRSPSCSLSLLQDSMRLFLFSLL